MKQFNATEEIKALETKINADQRIKPLLGTNVNFLRMYMQQRFELATEKKEIKEKPQDLGRPQLYETHLTQFKQFFKEDTRKLLKGYIQSYRKIFVRLIEQKDATSFKAIVNQNRLFYSYLFKFDRLDSKEKNKTAHRLAQEDLLTLAIRKGEESITGLAIELTSVEGPLPSYSDGTFVIMPSTSTPGGDGDVKDSSPLLTEGDIALQIRVLAKLEEVRPFLPSATPLPMQTPPPKTRVASEAPDQIDRLLGRTLAAASLYGQPSAPKPASLLLSPSESPFSEIKGTEQARLMKYLSGRIALMEIKSAEGETSELLQDALKDFTTTAFADKAERDKLKRQIESLTDVLKNLILKKDVVELKKVFEYSEHLVKTLFKFDKLYSKEQGKEDLLSIANSTGTHQIITQVTLIREEQVEGYNPIVVQQDESKKSGSSGVKEDPTTKTTLSTTSTTSTTSMTSSLVSQGVFRTDTPTTTTTTTTITTSPPTLTMLE